MIRIFLNRLVAFFFICFIGVTSSVFFVAALFIWLVTVLFDKRLRLLHLFTCLWASLYIWVFPLWSIKITNREKFDKNKTYVIVANHQSLVDILVASTLFVHFKWVSKRELFNFPLIGWNMRLNRYVRLRRGGEGNRTNIKKMYRACEKHLKRGSSVFVFPEGSRSETGTPGPFREGAFVLAKRRNVPVLPLAISGSRDTMENNKLYFLKKASIEIRVLDEIPPETFQDSTSKMLATQVRAVIARELLESK